MGKFRAPAPTPGKKWLRNTRAPGSSSSSVSLENMRPCMTENGKQKFWLPYWNDIMIFCPCKGSSYVSHTITKQLKRLAICFKN